VLLVKSATTVVGPIYQ